MDCPCNLNRLHVLSHANVSTRVKFLHTEFGFLTECAAYIDSAGGKQAEPLGLTE